MTKRNTWKAKQQRGLGMIVVDANGAHIATVHQDSKAQLIAAAPELLAVCQRFLEFANGEFFAYPPGSLQELGQAVAKATGEQA